jgi:hypothetical protein
VPQTLLRLTPPGRTAFEAYRKGLNAAFVEQLQGLSGNAQKNR